MIFLPRKRDHNVCKLLKYFLFCRIPGMFHLLVEDRECMSFHRVSFGLVLTLRQLHLKVMYLVPNFRLYRTLPKGKFAKKLVVKNSVRPASGKPY